jgi:hypothetical protein
MRNEPDEHSNAQHIIEEYTIYQLITGVGRGVG